jgi:hypothetical protein
VDARLRRAGGVLACRAVVSRATLRRAALGRVGATLRRDGGGVRGWRERDAPGRAPKRRRATLTVNRTTINRMTTFQGASTCPT